MRKKFGAFFFCLCLMIGMMPTAFAAKSKPSSIKLNRTSLTITVNTCQQLIATISPSNASSTRVYWKSSNTSVASVNSSGLVSAKKVGTATITASTANGKKATCKVTVKTPSVSSIKLNKTTLTMTGGKTYTLKATISPSGANKKVIWTSSNTSVATVSSSGKITAKNAGTAIITVTSQDNKNKTATCKVTVKAPSATKVKLSKTSVKTAGKPIRLSATVYPEYANQKVTWTSSNKKVATVSSTGVVTPKGYGTATITAKTANGKVKATCKVTVPKANTVTAANKNYASGAFPYWYTDTIKLVVDGLTGKIKSATIKQSHYENSVSDVTIPDGAEILYIGKDYVIAEATWTIAGYAFGQGTDILTVTFEYRLYNNGTLEVEKKFH